MLKSNNYNPDVLTCLANLSSDEVFTPPQMANKILDLLPKVIWSDKNARFLDPVCKSGVFLREIAKRLMFGLEKVIPDKRTRINHIYKNQLFGIAITELTSLLSRRSVYCSKTANGKYSVCENFNNKQGNICFKRIKHTWLNGKCQFCGASQEVYDRSNEFETHAYQFIHTKKPEEIFNMKFDVIVGNPPYQLDTGGPGRQAKPIYQHFVCQAKKLNPRYLAMIIPSRWFAGGMGLNEFREEMINDDRISTIVDYVDARECFPGVDIAGGVCYFLWEKDRHGDCVVVNKFKGKEFISRRPLNEFKTFIRFDPAVSILRKVFSKNEEKLTKIISPTRPFGLKTSDRPDGSGDIHLVSSGGKGLISSSRVTAGKNMINKWKVLTSKTSHDHAGQPDKDGTRRVLSRVEILKPNHVCTESYIILGAFTRKQNAENCLQYVKTKFVRFLVSLLSFSQDITRERFAYVPFVNIDELWTDKKLYKKYNLTEEEIDFVESMIRPMELANE
ncbi:MAG: Eco57I restriction-modification methylase domain-containing protein [Candidatus Aureabacteria bacterium]|nr:Eco57I restriction-modification methylase domain-containing protein [Candidatus Auribacterota bacterium]MCK5160082.1 Eco57I restriction-modification methylase domain-containing protein [Candidatus Auribacterota bacterium]